MPSLDAHKLALGLRLNKQFDRGKEQVLSHDQTSDVKLLLNNLLPRLQRLFKLRLLAEHPTSQTAYDRVFPEDLRSGHIEWLQFVQGLLVLHPFFPSGSIRGRPMCTRKVLCTHPKYL